MATVQITSFIFTLFVGVLTLIRIFRDSVESLSNIVWNLLFGGALYVMVNILGFPITLNLITGGIITFLGVPGVLLLVILKIIFRIF